MALLSAKLYPPNLDCKCIRAKTDYGWRLHPLFAPYACCAVLGTRCEVYLTTRGLPCKAQRLECSYLHSPMAGPVKCSAAVSSCGVWTTWLEMALRLRLTVGCVPGEYISTWDEACLVAMLQMRMGPKHGGGARGARTLTASSRHLAVSPQSGHL